MLASTTPDYDMTDAEVCLLASPSDMPTPPMTPLGQDVSMSPNIMNAPARPKRAPPVDDTTSSRCIAIRTLKRKVRRAMAFGSSTVVPTPKPKFVLRRLPNPALLVARAAGQGDCYSHRVDLQVKRLQMKFRRLRDFMNNVPPLLKPCVRIMANFATTSAVHKLRTHDIPPMVMGPHSRYDTHYTLVVMAWMHELHNELNEHRNLTKDVVCASTVNPGRRYIATYRSLSPADVLLRACAMLLGALADPGVLYIRGDGLQLLALSCYYLQYQVVFNYDCTHTKEKPLSWFLQTMKHDPHISQRFDFMCGLLLDRFDHDLAEGIYDFNQVATELYVKRQAAQGSPLPPFSTLLANLEPMEVDNFLTQLVVPHMVPPASYTTVPKPTTVPVANERFFYNWVGNDKYQVYNRTRVLVQQSAPQFKLRTYVTPCLRQLFDF